MKYLKQFIVGSSFPVFAPFMYLVGNTLNKNYSLKFYSIAAPLWWGTWNVISLILAEQFNLSIHIRFLLISLLSSITIMSISTYSKSYNFTKEKWIKYYLMIFLSYLVIWNVIVKNIEILI